MNQKKCKALRRKAYELAADKLKTMVNETEAKLINPKSVRLFEASQERCVVNTNPDGSIQFVLNPNSSRYFHRGLKKLYRAGVIGVAHA